MGCFFIQVLTFAKSLYVGFLFDDSSVEHDQVQKDLSKQIFYQFQLSVKLVHFGIMISSAQVSVPLKFSDQQASKSFTELVDNLQFPESESRVDLSMKLALPLLFSAKDSSNILIVFSDIKQQNEKEGVFEESEKLNAMGVRVFIIFIGAPSDQNSFSSTNVSSQSLVVVENSEKKSTEEVVTKLAIKVSSGNLIGFEIIYIF